MNYGNSVGIKRSSIYKLIAVFLCACICISFILSGNLMNGSASGAPTMDFGWDELSTKLDAYGSRYNAKRGVDYGSDTILSNADGGLVNAPLVGNGSLGGVFGGSSGGQSLNIGMNDFWNGQYDPVNVNGISPQTVGTVGYNVVADSNKGATDIDLATNYKMVTASSEEEGFPASAAVGGDYVSNAFWGMGWWSKPGAGRNSWLQLEFEEAITFSRFALWNDGSSRFDADLNIENNGTVNAWENGNTHAFRVEVSDNGTDWTVVHRENENYYPIYDQDLSKPATGKFVRLFISKSVVKGNEQAKVCKFSIYENAKNDKNLMPKVMNGANASIRVSSSTMPDRVGQDAAHIYTSSTVYATVCGVQQHLSGYGSAGYGWFTDTTPSNDYIIFKLNKPTTFKSYQLWNGSASTANAYERGDWTAWTVETSANGSDFKLAHNVPSPPSNTELSNGQPAITSFDIPSDSLANTQGVSYIKLTIKNTGPYTSRALLSQFKIFADTLDNSGIDQTNETTFIQNIKEGKVGVEASYGGQAYTASTSVSQDGNNYVVTEFKNSSNAPLTMRYYTSVHHYRSPDETQFAGVSSNKKTIYTTRTTPTAAPSKLAWVSAATIAATLEGGEWTTPGNTNSFSYGDFTVAPGATARVIAYVDCKQYNSENNADYYKVAAANSPTKDRAIAKLAGSDLSGAKIISDATNWWKEFWMKSFIEIHDKTVEEYYYTALYIVGAATREGSVPTSLFGPYVTSDYTAWGGTYVSDYNLYGTYMAVAASNREDLLKPLVVNAMESWGGLDGIGNGIGRDYADRFNEATLRRFRNSDNSLMFKNGVDGVLSAVVSGPHGYAVNMDGFYRILFTSAYAAIPVLSYFDMTQGEGEIVEGVKLTRQLEYDYLKDIMQLWEQILVYENGVYKVKYDAAWENEPNNMGNAFTIACMHTFAQRLTEHAAALGITEEDEPRLTKWAHIDANMEEYPTAMVYDPRSGLTRECYSDTLTSAQKNNVTYNGKTDGGSNPNVVVAQSAPLEQLGLYSDPAKKQIMRNSLATIKSWGNINAMPTIFSVAARVGYESNRYGNDTISSNPTHNGFDNGITTLMDQMKKVVENGFRNNNISKLVDPLQLIDTCGGAQGVHDMLVQNSDGIITFFPSYANDKAGRFVDIQLKGGYLVSGQQNANGEITFAKITSQYITGEITFAVPTGANWDIVDQDGNVVAVKRSTIGAIVGFDVYNDIKSVTFNMEKGKSYFAVPAAAPANSSVKVASVKVEQTALVKED